MTEKKSDQEIDLLSLFSIASKKFNSFLYFIINLFISFLNLFISLLTLIKKSYLLLLSALIIGGFIGNILQKKFFGPTYTSTLTLAPNFGSTYQLYGNIEFYQNLIKEEDFEKLNTYLNIDSSASKSLKDITIQPYTNELLKLTNYRNLLGTADSLTAMNFNYDDYISKVPFDNYSRHLIIVELNTNKVPTQIEERIIHNIENNLFYKNKKETYLENLKIKKEFILISLQKIDTLLFAEKKDAKTENLGTTIVLDENQNQNIDLQLFDRYTNLRNELVEINFELNDKKNVINTIDSFSDIGREKNSYLVIFSSLFLFLISLFLIIIKDFNKKLSNGSSLKFKKIDY
jgi:hypothetical protein